MKRILGSLLFIAIFAGCVSTPVETKDTNPVQLAADPLPQTQPLPPQKTVKEVVVSFKVPVLVKEVMSFADGVVDQYVQYQFDKTNTFLASKSTFNASSATPQEKSVYEYRDGRLVSETVTDAYSQVKAKHKYETNAQGKITNDTLLDSKDKIVSVQSYEYDAEGNRTTWKTFSGPDLRAVMSYQYDNGKPSIVEMKDSGGQLMGSTRFEYDSNGNLVKRIYSDKRGVIEKYDMLSWKEGSLFEEKVYGLKNNLLVWMMYEDYRDGVATRKLVKDSEGSIIEIRQFDYLLRDETKTIVVTE